MLAAAAPWMNQVGKTDLQHGHMSQDVFWKHRINQYKSGGIWGYPILTKINNPHACTKVSSAFKPQFQADQMQSHHLLFDYGCQQGYPLVN